jgi:hypothetical protein
MNYEKWIKTCEMEDSEESMIEYFIDVCGMSRCNAIAEAMEIWQ